MTPISFFTPAGDPKLFRCSCERPECDAPPPTSALLVTLNIARQLYERPITVTSGPRCRAYNAQEGGAEDSEHLFGEGADLACSRSRERWDLVWAAKLAGFRRIGIGPTFVHVGISERPLHPHDVLWTYYPRAKI